MTSPASIPAIRPTRARPVDVTPVVLRSPDGQRTPGRLEVVSLTGGLLSLSKLFTRGCAVRLMFLTDAGPLLAPAEMLPPVSWGQQPFRFVDLCPADQQRLGSAIQSWLGNSNEQDWIQKYRAAVLPPAEPRSGKLFKAMTAALLSLVTLVGALYLLSLQR